MNQRPEHQLEMSASEREEQKRQQLIDVYSYRNVVSLFVASVFASALAYGSSVLVGNAVLVPTWTAGVGAGFVTLLLVVMQFPLYAMTRRAIIERQSDTHFWGYLVSSQVQFTWALWLALVGGSLFHFLVAFVMCFWVFHDAKFMDVTYMRPAWLAMFPVFDVFLLVLKWLTSDLILGPPPAWGYIVLTVLVQAFVAALLLWMIDLVCGEEQAHELALMRLNRVQTERALLFRMSSLLGRGLALSSFWHDTRNAVQSVVLDAPFIRETWEPKLDLIDDEEEREDMAEALASVDRNARALATMLRDVKRTLGGAEELRRMQPSDIIDEAMKHVAADLRLRRIDVPPVNRDIEDAAHLWIPESQVRAIANVIINGAVRTHEDVSIIGRPVTADLYAFDIRDRGVDGVERETAIKRVRARLELGSSHDEEAQQRDGGTPGFGVGLMFARVQIGGRGGDIRVLANEDGRGLTFRVELRRPFGAPDGEP